MHHDLLKLLSHHLQGDDVIIDDVSSLRNQRPIIACADPNAAIGAAAFAVLSKNPLIDFSVGGAAAAWR